MRTASTDRAIMDRDTTTGSTPAARILLIEDDQDTRDLVTVALGALGHHVTPVGSGEEALDIFGTDTFNLVILDIGLPRLSGSEVLRMLRTTSNVPVLVLSGATTLDDRVNGFDLGADDYVTKPFEMPELDRRVRALLRRSAGPRTEEVLIGPSDIRLHLRSHEVFVGDDILHLTPKEFDVLRVLLARRGEVVPPDDLSVEIWGYETFGSRNYVEAHVSRLRNKLADAGAPDTVATVRGVGYMIR